MRNQPKSNLGDLRAARADRQAEHCGEQTNRQATSAATYPLLVQRGERQNGAAQAGQSRSANKLRLVAPRVAAANSSEGFKDRIAGTHLLKCQTRRHEERPRREKRTRSVPCWNLQLRAGVQSAAMAVSTNKEGAAKPYCLQTTPEQQRREQWVSQGARNMRAQRTLRFEDRSEKQRTRSIRPCGRGYGETIAAAAAAADLTSCATAAAQRRSGESRELGAASATYGLPELAAGGQHSALSDGSAEKS